MSTETSTTWDVVIVGAGFTGLAAAYWLCKKGLTVCVLEASDGVGGLAGEFQFSDGVRLEKFYHHWFNSDEHVQALIEEIGATDHVKRHATQTGMFFNGQIWRLSTPLDLLRFEGLSVIDRIRLGIATLWVRRLKNWKAIEGLSIRQWLEPLCGKSAYARVWEPLVSAKFSSFAEEVSAVWMWKKLVLRGGSRDKAGAEELLYFDGGFGALAQMLVDEIERHGGRIVLGTRVTGAAAEQGRVDALVSDCGRFTARKFLFTTAFPVVASILEQVVDETYATSLRRVNYLGNICLVLRLKQSLSSTYWLNVNDPGFPFVGVIEHTNFDSPDHYDGTRIVYLSRYISTEHPDWSLTDKQVYESSLEHLARMFPQLDRSWVVEWRVWRADYAQPVTKRFYSDYVPGVDSPLQNVRLASMAHIYPEDRGTNYAVRDGKSAAEAIALDLLQDPSS